ncbi:MAG: ABC transporter ATP-binding protein [Nitrososphaerota archaeon]
MIEFRAVHYIYANGQEALRGITLRIGDGEVFALAGENGAGKTTLLKHLNGLLRPTRGAVYVDGLDTRRVPVERLARNVGLVFQSPEHQLFCETVEQELAFGPRMLGLAPAEVRRSVEWALRFFGLEELRGASPLELSEGEKKRVAIASVAAWDPATLALDEPTIGQDALYRARLLELIRERAARGRTTIIASHDMEFLWSLQPRLAVMAEGKILRVGPIDRLLLDEALLERAGLLRPQLLELYLALDPRPPHPFRQPEEARAWLLGPGGGPHGPPR